MELICPGVRPVTNSSPADDQTRVATPAQAIAAGATRIVVGRPITRSDDVRAAARAVADQALGARSGGAGDEPANQPKAPEAHGRFDAL
ncbi:MAG TPA: orotidine 5'-phosphate decarboxylase / HUMPS family protein [Actinomycetes bacterium]|nr:orotidine 5'-phosphate decarboxylase / HUMPS family protein [Actinomycetes bacterium]